MYNGIAPAHRGGTMHIADQKYGLVARPQNPRFAHLKRLEVSSSKDVTATSKGSRIADYRREKRKLKLKSRRKRSALRSNQGKFPK